MSPRLNPMLLAMVAGAIAVPGPALPQSQSSGLTSYEENQEALALQKARRLKRLKEEAAYEPYSVSSPPPPPRMSGGSPGMRFMVRTPAGLMPLEEWKKIQREREQEANAPRAAVQPATSPSETEEPAAVEEESVGRGRVGRPAGATRVKSWRVSVFEARKRASRGNEAEAVEVERVGELEPEPSDLGEPVVDMVAVTEEAAGEVSPDEAGEPKPGGRLLGFLVREPRKAGEPAVESVAEESESVAATENQLASSGEGATEPSSGEPGEEGPLPRKLFERFGAMMPARSPDTELVAVFEEEDLLAAEAEMEREAGNSAALEAEAPDDGAGRVWLGKIGSALASLEKDQADAAEASPATPQEPRLGRRSDESPRSDRESSGESLSTAAYVSIKGKAAILQVMDVGPGEEALVELEGGTVAKKRGDGENWTWVELSSGTMGLLRNRDLRAATPDEVAGFDRAVAAAKGKRLGRTYEYVEVELPDLPTPSQPEGGGVELGGGLFPEPSGPGAGTVSTPPAVAQPALE